MSDAGLEQVREIQQDVTCPQCEYNLRGLRGDVVECPECGAVCDVGRLVSQRWRLPWYRAPGLNVVVLPVAWLVLGGIGAMLLLALVDEPIAWTMLPLVVAAGWLALMGWVWRWFGSVEGPALSLLSHVILGVYAVAAVGFLSMVLTTLGLVGDGQRVEAVMTGVMAMLFGVLFWGCRRAERFVGERCIRRHLRRAGQPTEGTTS